jgi:hypothetical protein
MSFDRKQFENLIRGTLKWFDHKLLSDSAVNLLMGTCAQESRFGTYLRQKEGPALGIMQIEPTTFNWLRDKYKTKYPWLADCTADELEGDLCLSIIMARLRYAVVPAALPDANDINELAKYWKKYYNTAMGAGTVEEFTANYKTYIK